MAFDQLGVRLLRKAHDSAVVPVLVLLMSVGFLEGGAEHSILSSLVSFLQSPMLWVSLLESLSPVFKFPDTMEEPYLQQHS